MRLESKEEGKMLADVEEERLRRAVAYYLYVASKDVPDGEAGIYRAAALLLIDEPVDAALLGEAEKRASNDDPLYNSDIRVQPELECLSRRHVFQSLP
jgi:hypothetical protein